MCTEALHVQVHLSSCGFLKMYSYLYYPSCLNFKYKCCVSFASVFVSISHSIWYNTKAPKGMLPTSNVQFLLIWLQEALGFTCIWMPSVLHFYWSADWVIKMPSVLSQGAIAPLPLINHGWSIQANPYHICIYMYVGPAHDLWDVLIHLSVGLCVCLSVSLSTM